MNEVFFLESQTSATRQIHFSHIKKTLFKWYCILSFDRKKLRNFSKSACQTHWSHYKISQIKMFNFLLTFEKKYLVAQFLVSSMNHKLQCDGDCNDAQSMQLDKQFLKWHSYFHAPMFSRDYWCIYLIFY